MCGILGIVGEVNTEKLIKAKTILKHRGPDNSQIYIDEPNNIGLGHQRLSIIDLSPEANQPMSNENGNKQIVFNGEIYNFKELRLNSLKNETFKTFKTNSDTEVILKLYENKGIEFLNMLNGMFAFAIYDKEKNCLLLARDRAGIKPLYYYYDGKRFMFASEIKALFELGAPKELNKEILKDFFNYQVQIGDETLFKGIKILEPGRYILLDLKSMSFINMNYWQPGYKEDRAKKPEDLLKKLEESVKRQMVADVPVGTFLSGGLDSSIITALAVSEYNKRSKTEPLKTFTAGFEGFEDEIEYAKQAAQSLGVENYSVLISPRMFIESLPRLIYKYDQPIPFASAVGLYFASKLAKENGIKVVLSGEGSDELFAGYSRYDRIQKILKFNKGQGIPGGNALFKAIKSVIKDPRYIKTAELSLNSNNFDYLTGTNAILPEKNKNHPLRAEVKRLFESQPDILTGLLHLDWHTYLQELLTKQDRMSMAVSIESRVPFLDNEVIDFANSLPSDMKLRNGKGKWILREAAKDILPDEIINRKKIGFSVPLDKWFKNELKEYIEKQLNNPICYKFFGEDYVKQTLKQNKRHDCSLQLWAMLNFLIWHEINFK